MGPSRVVLMPEADSQHGYEAMRRLLSTDPETTAVACETDRVAMGAYQACWEQGLRIPEDVSIVGFDDEPAISQGLRPGLTSVVLPHRAVGQWAVDRLVDRIDSPGLAPCQVLLPGHVVVRGSVAPPAHAIPASDCSGVQLRRDRSTMIDRLHAAEAEVALRAPHVNPRWRMAFHIMAPAGWINDPNGLCWFAGEYHAFFQHHPFSSEWGPMHWGHVVSTDLVSWRHAGIALAPGDASDADGCHSGSAVDNDGELAIVYTGHRYLDPPGPGRDPDRFTQVQNLAVSRDGIQFEKVPGNPVIAAPPADSTHHFRDPKVWREPGGWRLVLGNAAQDGRGRALLYGSSDLRSWELLGIVAESDGATGWMWECPDLFALDGLGRPAHLADGNGGSHGRRDAHRLADRFPGPRDAPADPWWLHRDGPRP